MLAGVYLGEYARDGMLVRLVRIGVNNLAGIPSIVYGIFGMGFFINYVGWHIDHSFFAHRLSKGPVFGTGGVLWAAPDAGAADRAGGDRRHGGGDPRDSAQRPRKLLCPGRHQVPDARPRDPAPGLAGHPDRIHPGDGAGGGRGRAADAHRRGQAAPTLPLDGKFPFLHLERQFMHLGFQIYRSASNRPMPRRPGPWST